MSQPYAELPLFPPNPRPADREPPPIVRTLGKIVAVLAIAAGALTLALAIYLYRTFAGFDPIVEAWIAIIAFPMGALGATMIAVGAIGLLTGGRAFSSRGRAGGWLGGWWP